jgi:hypothetical protein
VHTIERREEGLLTGWGRLLGAGVGPTACSESGAVRTTVGGGLEKRGRADLGALVLRNDERLAAEKEEVRAGAKGAPDGDAEAADGAAAADPACAEDATPAGCELVRPPADRDGPSVLGNANGAGVALPAKKHGENVPE